MFILLSNLLQDLAAKSDTLSSRDTVLKWSAVTVATQRVPHRQGSVNDGILAGNGSRQDPLTLREKKHSAGCMDEQ
jgi:hypothetical protein